MHIFLKYIFIIPVLLTLLSDGAAGQVRVSAQVDTSRDIYAGEDFAYFIVIEGSDTPGQADMTVFKEYNPRFSGNRQQSSTQIINNRATTGKAIIMTYLLAAGIAGGMQLPAVTVTIDGKNYQTNPVPVDILKPGTTDQLDLEVTLSEKQCYVGQPIIMTIKFYVSANIGDFRFDIPAFTSDDFYLEEPDAADPQAREYRLNNDITVRVSQYRTTHNGKDSIMVTFSKVLIPRRSGIIKIEPASVSADVAVGQSGSRDIFGIQNKRFMVSSKPAELNVLNLPVQDRPDGFYGLVGRYMISSSASPTKVSVGDPVTLNIKIGGSRYLKSVQWPALEQIPEMQNNFKIPSEKATPILENGFKIFTQTIRADNDKVTEIPPIPLVFFDPQTGQYQTAKTEPIKLEVSPSKVLTGADLEGMNFEPAGREIEAVKQGLSANYENLDALENQAFSSVAALIHPGYLAIWAGPLVLLICSAFAKNFTHTTPEKTAQKRRRSAACKAVNQLKKITSSDSARRSEELVSVMKQYIGERFDRTAGALTSRDCFGIIAEAAKDKQIADRFHKIIEDCETARYTSAQSGIEKKQIEEVIELIRAIEKKSR